MTRKARVQTNGPEHASWPDRRQGDQPKAVPGSQPFGDKRAQVALLLVVIIAVVIVVIAADLVFGSLPNTGSVAPAGSPSSTQLGVVVQGDGGHWTNVSPNQLAQMLQHKDFTLLNVKTPYSGEIGGTDLYIPYDQVKARASQLPRARAARILVYCRSGVQSVRAAQALLDLGYTNVLNLDGGMNAWQASGRALVNLNRT